MFNKLKIRMRYQGLWNQPILFKSIQCLDKDDKMHTLVFSDVTITKEEKDENYTLVEYSFDVKDLEFESELRPHNIVDMCYADYSDQGFRGKVEIESIYFTTDNFLVIIHKENFANLEKHIPTVEYRVAWQSKNEYNKFLSYPTVDDAVRSIYKWWKQHDYEPHYIRTFMKENTLVMDYGLHHAFYHIEMEPKVCK